MPKSSVGPIQRVRYPAACGLLGWVPWLLTTGVVGSGKKDTAGGLLDADDVGSGWGAEDAVLANDQLLDTVSSTDLCNQLRDLGVVVSAIATDNEERAIDALWDGKQDRGDEGLRVVVLLEDLDLLAEARTVSKQLVSRKQSQFLCSRRLPFFFFFPCPFQKSCWECLLL